MPQFILIAYDAKDADALNRRMGARAQHVASMDEMRKTGNILCGIAINDTEGKMIGSVVITNFATREAFDAWLKTEAYVKHKVWHDITVLNGTLGPTFSDLIKG